VRREVRLPPVELGDQLARSVFEDLLLGEGEPLIRTRAAFDARLQMRRAQIMDAAEAPLASLRRTLELRRELMTRLVKALPAWSAATTELRAQLDALVHANFIRTTPVAQLRELPRYLQAMAVRLDKLRDGQGRDAGLAAQVRPYWERYCGLSAQARADAAPGSALVRFRWMIEELRVSLFAQALGTRERVSPQRLEKQWEQVRVELRASQNVI
jgi:ATP-dependent helicase HrpA